MSTEIRLALPVDAVKLATVGAITYRETFNHYVQAELEKFLSANYTAANFHAELLDPSNTFWIVESNGEAVGYCQTGAYKLPLSIPYKRSLELRRLYLRQAYKGRQIGQNLMLQVMSKAKQQESEAILLSVWNQNYAAQRFYQKHGFEKIGEYDYPPIGEIIDREWIMQKVL